MKEKIIFILVYLLLVFFITIIYEIICYLIKGVWKKWQNHDLKTRNNGTQSGK